MSEIYQIEARRPAPVVPASGFVNFTAIVPNLVHALSLAQKMPPSNRILDPVSIGQQHENMVVYGHPECKIDAEHPAGIFTYDLASSIADLATARQYAASQRSKNFSRMP